MAEKKMLQAQPRTIKGRKIKNLRKDGLIAGNLYGSDVESVAIQMDRRAVEKMWNELGESQVFYVKIEGEKTDRPVLFDEIQETPVDHEITHLTLRQVNLKEKIQAEVEVVLVGENKVANAVVVQVHDVVSVEALPTDLPENFEIDISELTEIDQAVTFAQLKFDRSKVELLIEEEEIDSPVVLLQGVKEEVEEESVGETESVETEATAQAGAEGSAE